jgi:signal transduction histidine kinase/CheY-like chemotaxis protein
MLIIGLVPETVKVKKEVLLNLLDVTAAILRGDYSKRVLTDIEEDENIIRIIDNLNRYLDNIQLNKVEGGYNQEDTVKNFIEVISSFINLDFKQKLPISQNGTVMDAIATGINILGDELELSTASKAELLVERNRLNEAQSIAKVGSWEIDIQSFQMKLSLEAYRILEMECQDNESFEAIYSRHSRKIHPEDAVKTYNFFKQAIENRQGFAFQYRLVRDEGTVKDILCIGEIVTDRDGSLPHLKGTIQDITERKLVEKALNEAREKAEESNKAKSIFLANMSHEIRTPLNGILGLTDILLGENIQDEHRKYLELIRDSGKNLTQLINDILDLSKIESGKIQLENIHFNFREVLTANIRPYKFLAEQKGITLNCHFDPDIPQDIVGDPTRISQVLINLIGNAIKFTEEGSIHVIFALLESNHDEVLIRGIVQDTGIGIPADKLSTVFESFSQADESVTRKYGGTGLGLSIVKSLLSLMRGDVSVHSPVDPVRQRGTTFSFYFKAQAPVKRHSEIPVFNAEGSFRNKPLHVLIVDDNKINLLVARKMLEKTGVTISTAEDGNEAIKIAMTRDFDLILMDIQMPGLNGHETTAELRKMKYSKPIVALSANAYREDVERSLEAGMNAHMQKPFTHAQLVEVLREFC